MFTMTSSVVQTAISICPGDYDNCASYHNLSFDILAISEIGTVQLF